MKLILQFDNGTEVTTRDMGVDDALAAVQSVREGDGYTDGVSAVLIQGRRLA